MAAPNIVNVTTITGKTAVQEVTTSLTEIVGNSGGSNKVYKINAFYLCNKSGTDNIEVTVDLYRSSNSFKIAGPIVVPIDSTLDLLTRSIYLEEGDSIRVAANSTANVDAICSYEEIS